MYGGSGVFREALNSPNALTLSNIFVQRSFHQSEYYLSVCLAVCQFVCLSIISVSKSKCKDLHNILMSTIQKQKNYQEDHKQFFSIPRILKEKLRLHDKASFDSSMMEKNKGLEKNARHP